MAGQNSTAGKRLSAETIAELRAAKAGMVDTGHRSMCDCSECKCQRTAAQKYGDLMRLHADALLDAAERCGELERMAAKVNDVRNSIVGMQGFNFSEHAYPLVAALNEAGIEGLPYPEARANLGTLIEQIAAAESALTTATRERDEMAARAQDDVAKERDTIEAMLREIPGDMLEGDGDTPVDAVQRLRRSWEAVCDEEQAERTRADDLARRLGEAEDTLSRIGTWTHEHGAALKPKRSDTYGEGMRDAKEQVGALLSTLTTPAADGSGEGA